MVVLILKLVLCYMFAHDICDLWLNTGKCKLRMVLMPLMLEPAKLTHRWDKNDNLIALSSACSDVGEASSSAVHQRLRKLDESAI